MQYSNIMYTYLELSTPGVSKRITEAIACCLKKMGGITEKVQVAMLSIRVGCFVRTLLISNLT